MINNIEINQLPWYQAPATSPSQNPQPSQLDWNVKIAGQKPSTTDTAMSFDISLLKQLLDTVYNKAFASSLQKVTNIDGSFSIQLVSPDGTILGQVSL